MRNLRIRPTLTALGMAAALLLATGCEGGSSTTGGTSGTNGGMSGGATAVGPPPTNPRIFVSPAICYEAGTATFTITGGGPIEEYPVQLNVTDGGPTKKSWTKTTDENGDASWTLDCDSMPSDTYVVVMTWGEKNEKSSKAFLDILHE